MQKLERKMRKEGTKEVLTHLLEQETIGNSSLISKSIMLIKAIVVIPWG